MSKWRLLTFAFNCDSLPGSRLLPVLGFLAGDEKLLSAPAVSGLLCTFLRKLLRSYPSLPGAVQCGLRSAVRVRYECGRGWRCTAVATVPVMLAARHHMLSPLVLVSVKHGTSIKVAITIARWSPDLVTAGCSLQLGSAAAWGGGAGGGLTAEGRGGMDGNNVARRLLAEVPSSTLQWNACMTYSACSGH